MFGSDMLRDTLRVPLLYTKTFPCTTNMKIFDYVSRVEELAWSMTAKHVRMSERTCILFNVIAMFVLEMCEKSELNTR